MMQLNGLAAALDVRDGCPGYAYPTRESRLGKFQHIPPGRHRPAKCLIDDRILHDAMFVPIERPCQRHKHVCLIQTLGVVNL